MNYLLLLLVFYLGAIIGSFLNVVIERTHNKENPLKGRSHCPYCKHQLAWYDLIPLFSFLFLKGKCRYCHKNLSWQYFWVEFFTGILFVLNYYFFQAEDILFILYQLILASFLVVIFVYDLKYQLVYDRFSLPAIGLALLGELYFAKHSVSDILWGAFVGFAVYFILYLLSGGKDIGGGDIRLGVLMGILVGVKNILYYFLYAYGVALLYLFVYFLFKRKVAKKLPLGPFLIIGLYIILWGQDAVILPIKHVFSYIIDFLI